MVPALMTAAGPASPDPGTCLQHRSCPRVVVRLCLPPSAVESYRRDIWWLRVLDGGTKGALTPLEHGWSTTLTGLIVARPYDNEEHSTHTAARDLYACKSSLSLDCYYCHRFSGSTPGTLLASIVDCTYRPASCGEDGQLDKSFLG
jgi:hypothetical protein